MSFDRRTTYLCYNNRDLIRDGYIPISIQKSYIPPSSFNLNRLRSPQKGVFYQIERDEETDEILSVIETKRLLPASKLKVEITFSKVMQNAVTHPVSPGSIPGMGGFFGTPLVASMGFGGLTSGKTEMTIHVLDSSTIINRAIEVDNHLAETGIWECLDGYPLSVFGIVREHKFNDEEGNDTDDDNDDEIMHPGIPFSNEDLEQLGKISQGTWQGVARKRISGGTDSLGLFGGIAEPEVKFDNVKHDSQTQLFREVIRDERLINFRADNQYSPGKSYFPPRVMGTVNIDATSKKIRLRTHDENGNRLFEEGDTLYITYNVCRERNIRKNLVHNGTIAQGNTIGPIGFVGAISSDVDSFDYQICKWYVRKNSDQKINLGGYNDILKRKELNESENIFDNVEGWRLSESISKNVRNFWAADYRGIHLVMFDENEISDEERSWWSRIGTEEIIFNKGIIKVILPRHEIEDQEWFLDYLKTLDFIWPTGGSNEEDLFYRPEDFEKKIEDNVRFDRMEGYLFDISESNNTLLYDREKIPYYRPFAEFLRRIDKYDEEGEKSGVGIPQLDLLKLGITDLEKFDLSFCKFKSAHAVLNKLIDCDDEESVIYPSHYWSESYDASTDTGGVGAWLEAGVLDMSLFGWRPPGGNIQSYWKLETPYFCGHFGRNTRIYTERLGGPSLDNFSWIYVDTEPFVTHNISADYDYYSNYSFLVFKDDIVHQGLCYHKFDDMYFNFLYSESEIDDSKIHEREIYNVSESDSVFLNYNQYHSDGIGKNRILGDIPSFSHGQLITDDIAMICDKGFEKEFWFDIDLLNNIDLTNDRELSEFEKTNLNFDDIIPKANIPREWYLKRLSIDYFIKGVQEFDDSVQFYFSETDCAVDNVNLYSYNKDSDGIVSRDFLFNYYYGRELYFRGDFWKNISVKRIIGRFTSENSPNNRNRLNIRDYKIDEGQSSVVVDPFGRTMVFFPNSLTGNIDVALSYNSGRTWEIHKNIIRLLKNEAASLPIVIKDIHSDSPYVHLFYVLNDIFIMYKRINVEYFYYDDVFVELDSSKYPPSQYDKDSYDFSKENPEKDFWGDYSDLGTALRRTPSYFVVGDSEDMYFKEQIKISIEQQMQYQVISDPNDPMTGEPHKVVHARFQFVGDNNGMRDNYDGSGYTVHVDHEGVIRLILVSDGKMTIKRSNNMYGWDYDVIEADIHNFFKEDKENEGISNEIRNLQIIRNYDDGVQLYLLYFNNNMLFLRHFDTVLLFSSKKDDDGTVNKESSYVKLVEDSPNKPIFIIGNIPDRIKRKVIDEKNNNLEPGLEGSDILVRFPYTSKQIEEFDEKFSIDVDTQPYAITSQTGLSRIFYKDIIGNLNSVVLNGSLNPVLEIWLKNNKI